jgi:Ca2+/H+ antiporter, TMEM165/GDT1 family
VIPFYLTFIAVMLSGLAARDQVTVAHQSRVHGRRGPVLAISVLVSIATAAFAGWAAIMIVPLMAPAARVFLCAMAVAFAGVESLVIAPRAARGDPSSSLGLFLLTLLAHQLTDAARFIVFGIAVAAQAPITAGAGGALGGIALVGVAWAYPAIALDAKARFARRLLGLGFIFIGAWLAMRALDWV